jgi:hypothetical protein
MRKSWKIVMRREGSFRRQLGIGRPGKVESFEMTKYGRLLGEKSKYFTTSNAGTTVSAARKTNRCNQKERKEARGRNEKIGHQPFFDLHFLAKVRMKKREVGRGEKKGSEFGGLSVRKREEEVG